MTSSEIVRALDMLGGYGTTADIQNQLMELDIVIVDVWNSLRTAFKRGDIDREIIREGRKGQPPYLWRLKA